jgi:hypothetical protein
VSGRGRDGGGAIDGMADVRPRSGGRALLAAQAHAGTRNLGGPIATAGVLVFIGAALDSKFRAYDSKTGKEL